MNQLLDLASQVSDLANSNPTAKEGIANLKRIEKRLRKLGCPDVDRQLDVVLATKNRTNFKNHCAFLSTCVQEAEASKQEQTEFAYARISTTDQTLASQMEKFEANCPNVQVLSEEGVSGTTEAKSRPVLGKLLRKLKQGDTLWVWWFDRLGRDYHDAKETAQLLLKRGVAIKTIHGGMSFQYTGNTVMDATTDNTINMLAAIASNEREARLAAAEAGREAIKTKGVNKDGKTWSELYQGRKANTEQHEQIMRLVADGKNNTQIAKALGCSTKTVQRVKKSKLEGK